MSYSCRFTLITVLSQSDYLPTDLPFFYTRIEEYITPPPFRRVQHLASESVIGLLSSISLLLAWKESIIASVECKNDIIKCLYRVWREQLNGYKVSRGRLCTAFRTRGKTITHPWPPSNLHSSFVIFHVRFILNYVWEVTQCTFWRILGSFLSKLLKKLSAFHLKSLNLHAKRITYVRVIL